LDTAFTSFVLGYHGCDRRLAEKIFAGEAILKPSHNDYDWLGDGIYFWEHNAHRAHEFACELRNHPRRGGPKITEPAVVGAIFDLGFCLNLLDTRYIALVRQAHDDLILYHESVGTELPTNSVGADLLKRNLDCAVLRMLHRTREEEGERRFETVRAAFIEGERLYPGAGFAAKNHIQICVRDARCIKGYFRPIDDAGKPISFSA
jgi:hypothetical protein